MDSIRFNEFYERCNSRATRDPFEPAWVDYNAIDFKHSVPVQSCASSNAALISGAISSGKRLVREMLLQGVEGVCE